MGGWLTGAILAVMLLGGAASAQDRAPAKAEDFHVVVTLPPHVGSLPERNRIHLFGRTAQGEQLTTRLALVPDSQVRYPDGKHTVIFRLAPTDHAAYQQHVTRTRGILPMSLSANLCRQPGLQPGAARVLWGVAGRNKRTIANSVQPMATTNKDGSSRLNPCTAAALTG